MFFSNLPEAFQHLETNGTGTLIDVEKSCGSMQYAWFETEATCFNFYEANDQKVHAVNFSCIPSAASRLYLDWELPKELYTSTDESQQHAVKIRNFLGAVETMTREMKITRHVRCVVENRTRRDEVSQKFKPSFHIHLDLWFPCNFEMMREFVTEAMNRSSLDIKHIDFGAYQINSLLRVIGCSSKTNHKLPKASERDFMMSLTASMTEAPDVTPEHMAQLKIQWTHRVEILPQPCANQDKLQNRILHMLKQHGETITKLYPAPGQNTYYGANTIGRNCLTFSGTTHHRGGNRCVVWLYEGRLFYKCLDPEHKDKIVCLDE